MLNVPVLNHVSIEDAEILVRVCVETQRNAMLSTTFLFATARLGIEAIRTLDAKLFPVSDHSLLTYLLRYLRNSHLLRHHQTFSQNRPVFEF